MTKRLSATPAPAALEEYSACFDPLFDRLNQRADLMPRCLQLNSAVCLTDAERQALEAGLRSNVAFVLSRSQILTCNTPKGFHAQG